MFPWYPERATSGYLVCCKIRSLQKNLAFLAFLFYVRMGRPVAKIDLTEHEEEKLKLLAKRRKTFQGDALRARIVLRAAKGLSNTRFADELATHPMFVEKVRDIVGLYLNRLRRRLFSRSTRGAVRKRWNVRSRSCRYAPDCQRCKHTTMCATGPRHFSPPSTS